MPSSRISTRVVSLRRFDVVGADGDEDRFVSHVGLAATEDSYPSDAVAILDMGPPLHGSILPNTLKVSTVGLAELNDDEVQKIRTFIDQHASEHQIFAYLDQKQILRLCDRMYCILPHALPFYEDDGRYSRMRFNCSGFVLEAYRSARISLVNIEELPAVTIQLIQMAYPREARLMESGRVNPVSLGLVGNGPWPVLLCGYLIHALDRPGDEIRQHAYAPSNGDQYFPRLSDGTA